MIVKDNILFYMIFFPVWRKTEHCEKGREENVVRHQWAGAEAQAFIWRPGDRWSCRHGEPDGRMQGQRSWPRLGRGRCDQMVLLVDDWWHQRRRRREGGKRGDEEEGGYPTPPGRGLRRWRSENTPHIRRRS